MIVKDEAAVIERCLTSVRPLLSGWVVVDTGSSDGTPELVARALHGLPGALHQRRWVDFGTNRSELMALARGVGTHLLLVDADMTLRIEGGVDALTVPDADAALLRHEGDPEYWIPRVVRADRAWSYVGATHEYLACDGPHTTARWDALVVEHHADGGSRGDKFERDRRLLEAELERRPDDPRTVFYLAQTLRDLGHAEDATALYRRRVELGGWAEEQFYAQLQVGVLTAATDWFAAVPELLAAWEMRPQRAEPLLELARGYRALGAHRLARAFAEQGLALPYPTDDLLFVHTEAWDWALRFERAVAAYHCGDPETALADNDQLLADGVPPWVDPWVRHNRAWCLEALGRGDGTAPAFLPTLTGTRLSTLADLAPSTRHTLIDLPDERGWSTFNPSLGTSDDGVLHLLLRSANYRLAAGGRYDLPEPVVRTANRLVPLDDRLRPAGPAAALPEVPEGDEVHPSRVSGCEDLRLVALDGRWRATATVRDRNPEERCEVVLLDLGPVGGSPTGTTLQVLSGPEPELHQKNWMPFVHDGALHLVYRCTPTVVLRVGEGSEGAAVTTVSRRPGPPALADARGGSPGLAVPGGVLFLVHEAVGGGPLGRIYTHRLVLLADEGDGWAVTAVSAPFHLLEPTVEFCAGLARHPADPGTAVLSYGRADAEAWLATVALDELLSLLVPVAPPAG